jgi:hypothetical protein
MMAYIELIRPEVLIVGTGLILGCIALGALQSTLISGVKRDQNDVFHR